MGVFNSYFLNVYISFPSKLHMEENLQDDLHGFLSSLCVHITSHIEKQNLALLLLSSEISY